MEIESKICKSQNNEKKFAKYNFVYENPIEKNIYVIRNNGTEDCYTATCNHAVQHIQCIKYQSYNKKIK